MGIMDPSRLRLRQIKYGFPCRRLETGSAAEGGRHQPLFRGVFAFGGSRDAVVVDEFNGSLEQRECAVGSPAYLCGWAR
jgi:hypothetical protein